MSEEQTQTAADIKKQIQKAQEELKNSALPVTGMLANEVNANTITAEAEVKPEPQPAAAKRVEDPKPSESKDQLDVKEWAKKKGIDWTTDESILKALHRSDQAFHEKRQRERQMEPANQPGYIPPAYTPPAPPVNYQPAPAYAQPPQNNRAMIENIARTYNMTADDAEKLLPMMKDFYEAANAVERKRIEEKMATLERENQKNSVFRELASDPAFRNPEVAMEYHKTLEEMQASDPRSFEEDPRQYVKVFDRALANIARRKLMGQPLQEAVPPIAKLPTNPPRQRGEASGGGALENENSMSSQQFARLSLKEQRDYLTALGLRPTN